MPAFGALRNSVTNVSELPKALTTRSASEISSLLNHYISYEFSPSDGLRLLVPFLQIIDRDKLMTKFMLAMMSNRP